MSTRYLVAAIPALALAPASLRAEPMKATAPADPARIAFEFVDGTNLAAYPGRMQRLVILTPGPDRQVQEWTDREAGKDSTDVFDLKRVQ